MKKKKMIRSALTVGVLIGSLLVAGLGGIRAIAQDVRLERVDALSYRTFTMKLKKGELTELAIIGDGDNDLDLFVYDPNGRLLVSDEDASDQCYVRWNAPRSGNSTIKVVNLGRVYSDFAIIFR